MTAEEQKKQDDFLQFAKGMFVGAVLAIFIFALLLQLFSHN